MAYRNHAETYRRRAQPALVRFETYDQKAVDEVVTAVSWAGYHHAAALGRLGFEETGLGSAADKTTKIRRKTLGTLRDLRGAPSVGVLHIDERRGITEIAKPVGIVAALTPVTNPAATAVNNIMIALKGRNAIILAPHPGADRTCAAVVEYVHGELDKIGAPRDLVQHFSLRADDKAASRDRAAALMREADIVLVTSGPGNVLAAYQSGTPALGVGLGNVPVIVDGTANLPVAALKIAQSKRFDHATSCSSENALIIEHAVYSDMLNSLTAHGGFLLSPKEKTQLQKTMWNGGALNRAIVAQSAETISQLAGLENAAASGAQFLMVEEDGIGPEFPFSGEKLSPVLTLYRYRAFNDALKTAAGILDYQGNGHSCGIHSENEQHILALAHSSRVARVLVNQAHCFGNGGDFANGLDFTLSMGAGTWGGNSTCDNITYSHLLNVTRLARPIAPMEPTEEELWGDYLRRYPTRTESVGT
ncbi:MAG: aldehyde dehydrogenase family protein [Acidobacteriota bacterium]|nr:aldehyde dehydrogenase family protein [Acidobacteriota bacterium]